MVLRADPVAVRAAAARAARGAPPLSEEIAGRDAVARIFAGRAGAAEAALVDGTPGAVRAPGGTPRAAFVMRWRDGKVVAVEIVVDPRRLRRLEVLR